jgi:hypothetical protein
MSIIQAIIDFFKGLFGSKKKTAGGELPIVQIPVPKEELTAPYVVTIDGNSMSKAYAPFLKKELTDTYGDKVQVFDFSIAGQTTNQMINAAGEVDSIPEKDPSKTHILVVWEVRNEMNLGVSTSAAQAVANLKRYCYARHDAGFDHIVVLGVLPSGGGFGGSWGVFSYAEVNNLLREDYIDFATYFVDLFALCPQLQNPFDTEYYNADKLHLTKKGSELVATTVARFINTLIVE